MVQFLSSLDLSSMIDLCMAGEESTGMGVPNGTSWENLTGEIANFAQVGASSFLDETVGLIVDDIEEAIAKLELDDVQIASRSSYDRFAPIKIESLGKNVDKYVFMDGDDVFFEYEVFLPSVQKTVYFVPVK
jgi:hypothetical protein